MKNIFVLFSCYFISLASFAQDPDFVYVKEFGGKSTEYIGWDGMAMDASNNIYSVGSFNDTVDFDPNAGVNNLISSGNFDIFISKLDNNGNFMWVKQIGGTLLDYAFVIKVSPAGNVYVAGYVNGTVDMDPGPGVVSFSGTGHHAFVLKLNTAGNFEWVREFNSSSGLLSEKVYFESGALDGSENLYLGGVFGGTVDFNPDSVAVDSKTSHGNRDLFVLKLNSAGNWLWSKTAGSTSEDFLFSITLDSTATVYATGRFYSTVDFNPSPAVNNSLTATGNSDVFVWKLDAAGNYVWAKKLGGTNAETGQVIAIDNAGYVYTAGYFKGTADFDPDAGIQNLSHADASDDIFLSVLTSAGAYVDAYRIGDTLTEWPTGILFDSDNNLYLSGSFQGTVNFTTDNVNHFATSVGSMDGFLLKLDVNREFSWFQQFKGSSFGEVRPSNILLDAQKNIYLNGHFNYATDFDPGAGTAILDGINFDTFVLKLSQVVSSGFTYSPLVVCKNATVNFTNTSIGATSYSWTFQGGNPASSTAMNPAVVFTGSGNKTVTLIATNGNSTDTLSQVINVKALPSANITPGGPLSFCSGGSVLLSANTGTGFTYAWRKNGNPISGAISSGYSATSTGTYKVIVYNSNGCSSSSPTVSVTVNTIPSTTITAGGPVSFCAGDSVILSGPSGTNRTYQWKKSGQNISGATAITYTAKESGTYKVTVTNTLTGCSGTTASGIAVTKKSLPAASVTPQGPTTFCAGQNVVLMANSGGNLTYQWRQNGVDISGAIAQTYTAFVAGNYKVNVTNTSTGCSKLSSPVAVIVNCRLEEQLQGKFNGTVAPNPFQDHTSLIFDSEENAPINITVMNLTGQLIEKRELTNDQLPVTVGGDWLPGSYFVRASQGERECLFHIVKQ